MSSIPLPAQDWPFPWTAGMNVELHRGSVSCGAHGTALSDSGSCQDCSSMGRNALDLLDLCSGRVTAVFAWCSMRALTGSCWLAHWSDLLSLRKALES